MRGVHDVDRKLVVVPEEAGAVRTAPRHAAQRSAASPSNGALRDAMARGAQELCCFCRPVWP